MVLHSRFTLVGMYPDHTGSPWLNDRKKFQSMSITGARHSHHIAHMGTPNWRKPYHLRSSKSFDDWRELQLVESQRAAPGSKLPVMVYPQLAVSSEYTGVNQVAQSGGIIAIASSTVRGGDDSFPTVDNMGPSLLFWKENSGINLLFSAALRMWQ